MIPQVPVAENPKIKIPRHMKMKLQMPEMEKWIRSLLLR
jgi:hypothetical protein